MNCSDSLLKMTLHQKISLHQSGFKLGNSCNNQRLSITHETYQSFDECFGVGSIYCVYSGISGNLLNHCPIS